MFDTLRLSVGRLQSRRSALETQRAEYERKLAEGQAGLKQDLADAQASRVKDRTLTTETRAWAAHDGRRPGADTASTQGANLSRDAALWMTPDIPNGGRTRSAEVVAAKGRTEAGKRQV